MNAVGFAVVTSSLLVGYAAYSWLARVYIRATELQSVWPKRIDSLLNSDWEVVHRRLEDAEFKYLLYRLNTYKQEADSDLAPTLREVIVQFHTDP